MRRNRRVKIVATLGPASAAPEMIERLFIAGVDVFRINLSHSTHDGAKALYNAVRACAARHRHPIGILADLQGPKFRIGNFDAGRVKLTAGSIFKFDRDETLGTGERVFLPHTQIFEAIKPGHTLVLDDGKLRMRVIETSPVQIHAEVTTGGLLASRKGISMPDTLLPISPLTEKDKADLVHALKLGVDWVALSFVQRAEDVHEVRKLIGSRAAIVSKIEKPSAVADLEDVIAASDAIMVARGDLGVEMPVEKVPGLQKKITRLARAAGKPVIIATQMLESMISSPMPTRAEVSDVATAVFDGADAIMLSAESAVGQYPVEAIQMMDKIAIEVEQRSRLRADVARDANRAAADRRRRDCRCRLSHCRHGQARRHRLLHGDRLDSFARHARAARHPRNRLDADRVDGQAAIARLGCANNSHGRS